MQVQYAVHRFQDGYAVVLDEPARRVIWRTSENPFAVYVTFGRAVEAKRIDATARALQKSKPLAAGTADLQHARIGDNPPVAVLRIGTGGRYRDYWFQDLGEGRCLFEGCDPPLESRDDVTLVPP